MNSVMKKLLVVICVLSLLAAFATAFAAEAPHCHIHCDIVDCPICTDCDCNFHMGIAPLCIFRPDCDCGH